MAELFFIYNNKFYSSGTPVISSENRSLRYGDGLFETMKMLNGKIINSQFHFERLFNGLSLLQFEIPKNFTTQFLQKKIDGLVAKNKHTDIARIRLMLFRSDGGLFDAKGLKPNYIIESWALNNTQTLNESG